jgi:hypothetical protein
MINLLIHLSLLFFFTALYSVWGKLALLILPLFIFILTFISRFKRDDSAYDFILIGLGVFFVYYLQFGYGVGIHYGSVDAAGHFDMCRTYSENGVLLTEIQSRFMSYKDYPILYYVNCGLFVRFVSIFFDGFKSEYFAFVVFNFMLLFYLVLATYQVIKIFSSGLAKFYVFSFLLFYVLGFPAKLMIDGFYSQLCGLIFFTLYIYIALTANLPRLTVLTFKSITLILVLLAYHYYIFELLLFELLLFCFAGRQHSGRYALQLIGLLVFTVSLFSPIIPSYFRSSALVSTDGGIYKDLVGNFLLIFPAFFNLFLASANVASLRLKLLTLAVFSFSFVNFIAVSLNYSSPYYFYKNYPVLYLILVMNFFSWFQFQGRVFVKNWVLKAASLCALIFLYTSSSYVARLLGAHNNLIQEGVFAFYKTPIHLNDGRIDLLLKLSSLNFSHQSTCIATKDPVVLIWSNEITRGIFFRGVYNNNNAWSSPIAWTNVDFDASCDYNYNYYLRFTCVGDWSNYLFANSDGCLHK